MNPLLEQAVDLRLWSSRVFALRLWMSRAIDSSEMILLAMNWP